MSSDADYASFLDKANQDTGANKPSSTTQTQTQSKSQAAKTKAVNTKAAVPSVLQDVKVDYTSEADEPFEGVSLSYEGKGLPDADAFASLLGKDKSEVSETSAKDFDPRREYGEVMDAVKKAGHGEVKVFRVEIGKARVEYFVVGLDGNGKRVVGLKALAVES